LFNNWRSQAPNQNEYLVPSMQGRKKKISIGGTRY